MTVIQTFQPASGNDTRILKDAATTNYITGVELAVGNGGSTNTQRTLIKFDLSTIPADATIVSATLSLWTKTDYSTNTRTITAFRLIRDWVPNQATWNVYSTGNSWGTAGASGIGTDITADGVGTGSVSVPHDTAVDTEIQMSLTASKVQELIDGTYSNYGWLLIAATESSDMFEYHSSRSATAGYRPKLVIEYAGGGLAIIWSSE